MSHRSERTAGGMVLKLMLCIGVWPVTFVAVVLFWRHVDRVQGQQEVQEFIQSHQAIVAERRKNPRVYAFDVAADQEDDSRLLVEWDVADKETYLMLDDDVSGWINLSQTPTWRCKMRSDEELPNDFGAMAFGIGELGEALFRLKVAVAVATLVTLVVLAGCLVQLWSAGKTRTTIVE